MQSTAHDCRTIATIEADVVQALAADNFGGPLTEDELDALADILSATDKSDLIAEAILQIRPWLAPEPPHRHLAESTLKSRLAILPAELPHNTEDDQTTYLPYELNRSEIVATIEVIEIQSFAEDNFGGPLTEEELRDLAVVLAESDKSDLMAEAILQVRPSLN